MQHLCSKLNQGKPIFSKSAVLPALNRLQSIFVSTGSFQLLKAQVPSKIASSGNYSSTDENNVTGTLAFLMIM